MGDTALKQPGHLPGVENPGKGEDVAGADGGGRCHPDDAEEEEENEVTDDVDGNGLNLTGGVLIGRALTLSGGTHYRGGLSKKRRGMPRKNLRRHDRVPRQFGRKLHARCRQPRTCLHRRDTGSNQRDKPLAEHPWTWALPVL
jgi:hypothetical protein